MKKYFVLLTGALFALAACEDRTDDASNDTNVTGPVYNGERGGPCGDGTYPKGNENCK